MEKTNEEGSVSNGCYSCIAFARCSRRRARKGWYDGGSEFNGSIIFKRGCPKSDESPAEVYKEIETNIGYAPQIIDRSDQVEVKSEEEGYFFFRTKKACERYVSQLSKEKGA